ncbi:radial spoke head 14 homolog [Pungitius pungitius]|uniref:radial spoke head 14 homolog n=1 Tax=Pungitius pungitius TaxID=134920 RepID=UPI002E1344A4
MTGPPKLWTRAPVAFGRLAVPQLFGELTRPEADVRLRALVSLCGLMRDPERVYQAVRGGFLEQLKVLFVDEDPSVRTTTCELLHLMTSHSISRQALLSSSLLPPLALLMDDSSSSCRRRSLLVLNGLALLPEGAEALLTLIPKLMQKLRQVMEEEVEVKEVLLLSTITSCSRLNALPALACDAILLVGGRLSHLSPNIRREASAALMALSACEEGRRRVCEEALLPAVVELLQDGDVEVQANAAGVLMYTSVITTGRQRCLDLNVIPVLLDLVTRDQEEQEETSRSRKALVMFSLRALTALAEAPVGRCLLLEQLPLLVRRSGAAEEDLDVRRAAQTAVRVITWTP